ncbi:phage tail assembly chaperone G, partial [Halolactibacillus halophilus]|uniref:phage tail assembly chaperone G n=1 Tax=Halolactibacillus halophilus TaxID=306540 RepID=UPI0035A22169
ANEVFAGKITTDDIYNRLHAPGGQDVLKQQLIFVAQGQQSDETKNFLAKKN